MKYLIQIMVLITAMSGMMKTASAVSLECMEFETFPPNVPHPVGTTYTHNDLYSELVSFQWDDGTWFSGGNATAVTSNNAYGSGQEVNLNNINLRYIFDVDQPYIVIFRYADAGIENGNINLGINGILSNTQDLSDLDGMNIGGVDVIVTRHDEPSIHHGTVTLIGRIERFGVGGQEFWVDDVCALFG
jgi:hypothetical protein